MISSFNQKIIQIRAANTLSGIVVLFILPFLLSNCSTKEKVMPNLLFIMMDDLGYGQFALHNDSLTVEAFDPYFMQLVVERQDYSPEQALEFSRRAMPTLSQLAKEGAVFTRAFAPSNLCAPSRISIATGTMQQPRGIYVNMDTENLGLEPGSHLAHKLKEMGYATAHIGKWHMGIRNDQMIRDLLKREGMKEDLSFSDLRTSNPAAYQELWQAGYYGSVIDEHNPLQNGFDYYYGYNNWASQFYNSTLVWEGYDHAGIQPGYNTDHFTDKALEFISKQVSKDQPFFVQLHYHAVHDSLEPKAPDVYFSKFPSDSYDLTNFYAHVYGVDYNIQRILDYLEEKGMLENTLIVFTSDNGAQAGLSGVCGPSVLPGNAPFPGTKGSFFQGGIRIPFVFYWPAGIKKSRVCNQLATNMDILPTFIDAAGGEVPAGLDGKSLLSLLTSDSEEVVHEKLMWAGRHSRSWGFNINRSFLDRSVERRHAPPCWVVITDSFLLRYVGAIEPNLYHECPGGTDPSETHNLIETEPDMANCLGDTYKQWAKTFTPPVRWSREKWEEIAD